ncbi:MAG: hypothetical protein IT174_15915 [Acidobacteria bacterium]|nr:hypothetical protein [Acidobacteriota bacterium]
MKVKYIQILGTVLAVLYGVFIVFLYAAEPRSLGEVTTKAMSAVESTVTKGQVLTGTYEIDQARFNEGIAAFRADNFVLARDRFERADPEKRDANTQFYIAYSYYRQGWGRVSNDDALFKAGLEALQIVPQIDPDFVSKDADLTLKTAAELRNEFEEGLKVTADDFNPLRLVRERK